MYTWEDVERRLAADIEVAGFEVLGAGRVGAYNQSLETKYRDYRLPDFDEPASVVLLIGNTRRLWPKFLDTFANTTLSDEEHPLDGYSRMHVGAAVSRVAGELALRHELRYSFDPAPRSVAIQRLAALTGAAEVAPIGLCIHPLYGPWFSLRAAAVFSVSGPEEQVGGTQTCSRCDDKPCLAARERVLAQLDGEAPSREAFERDWQGWLAMRDACPIGRDQRYSEEQILYHYTKDKESLRRAALMVLHAQLD
jgi:hypothetical protein